MGRQAADEHGRGDDSGTDQRPSCSRVDAARRWTGVALIWSAVGCASGSSPADRAPSAEPTPEAPDGDALDALYAPDHRVEVSIELDPADWQALRAEGRRLFDGFLEESGEFEFTDYVGTASVDGVRYENVGIRKKGFLGSLSRPRPSLKLDFGEVEDEAALRPVTPGAPARTFERLTLNNNRQDFSRARTCVAYVLFDRAGLPAPRCNLAHVVVNGEDLGTYSNVEPIKKPLLSRHFGDASGNLYEAQLADFARDEVAGMQPKTNEELADRSDLDRLVAALEVDDGELVARLGEAIDLDQFRDVWALETLAGHWDGYAGNRNNFYVYAAPSDGRLRFIPWGTDGAFTEAIPGDSVNTSGIVYARGLIAQRLYALPEQRALYRERLAQLAEQVWVEDELVGTLEQLTALATDSVPSASAELRSHLESHGQLVRERLAAPAPEWVDLASETSPCSQSISDFTIEFATQYGDLNAIDPTQGTFQVALSMDGAPPVDATWFGRAGVDATSADPSVVIRSLAFFEDGRGIFLQISVPPAEFAPGARTFHGFETVGVVVALDGDASRFVGFISEGTLELEAASALPGAPVRGRARAKLLQTGCAEL